MLIHCTAKSAILPRNAPNCILAARLPLCSDSMGEFPAPPPPQFPIWTIGMAPGVGKGIRKGIREKGKGEWDKEIGGGVGGGEK